MDEDEFLSDDETSQMSPTAEDYYDFSELCEVDESAISTTRSSDSDAETPDVCLSNNYASAKFNGDVNIPRKPFAPLEPLKFINTDINSLFPGFRKNAVLRFNRIFDSCNSSNKSDIWRAVRKRNEVERSLKKDSTSQNNVTELEVESDEEIRFLLDSGRVSTSHEKENNNPLTKKWRFGASRFWYDKLDLPEDIENYDYGFKQKEPHANAPKDDVVDEAFLMVNQLRWEDDIIWDGNEVREDVLKNVYSTHKFAGWIPTTSERTAQAYKERVKLISGQANSASKQYQKKVLNAALESEASRSMFPEENEKLLHDNWEDDVIWDSDAMVRISYPKNTEINDENIIDIPNEIHISEVPFEMVKDHTDEKYRPSLKQDVEEDMVNSTLLSAKTNFYNISNDEYYNAKLTQDTALMLSSGGKLLQHSIPAVQLISSYFPTYMGPQRLKQFHRRPLKVYSHGDLSRVDFHGVHSLVKHIEYKRQQRVKEMSGGGQTFFMHTPEDLSAKDGELVFFEYSEEHPPLMMQVGMASKIKNYYRRKPESDAIPPAYKYGEATYVHTSPFLGSFPPGQSIQAIENNMFRSPIYEHSVPDSDFLIIRTRHKYYIRIVETVYIVGQELPLMEVPAPRTEKANSFMKDFLQIFIYRLFWKSEDNPRKIKMEDIRKAFPSHQEFSVRKCLKLCAEFRRAGPDSKSWMLKSNSRLPPEEEISQMISPEECCAYYSMLAAEQRLKDAGYGDKFQLVPDNENDEFQMKNDEIKAAPWNTTQAFISAVRGKSLLQLSGVADPTGCGEGFSYVKAPCKPQWLREAFNLLNPARRLITGTDADLRCLSLVKARKLLKKFNVPGHEVKKMSRWQIVDVVRTICTEQAKLGEDNVLKFARGNTYCNAVYKRKYKEECQRVFDLQNKMLSSFELLSSDEESCSEEESDLEEMGKHIENILTNKRTAEEFTQESEENQRKELQKIMASESLLDKAQENKYEEQDTRDNSKILKIFRTYQNSDGFQFVRVETVRNPAVIQRYTEVKEMRDDEYVRNYALGDAEKEAIRTEKRRIQDQLRRLKKQEVKEKMLYEESVVSKAGQANQSKVTCGACGARGHMRSNKACPLFRTPSYIPPIQVAMTEEEEADEKACLNDQNAINLDETKLIVPKSFLKQTDEVRRKSLVLKIPKNALYSKKRKTRGMALSDYFSLTKYVNRKRRTPINSISVIFENLLKELKNLPHTQPFWFRVSKKIAANYHLIIQEPMDLHTMRDKVRNQEYKCRNSFLSDLSLILENCKLYNGPHSFLSFTAQTMVDHCMKCFSEQEESLLKLEKSINPLLDDDQVAFSFMLETIVNDTLKAVPESWPFHKPVDKKVVKNYYDIVKTPMDLDTIARNCKANKYKSTAEFVADVELLHTNSLTFNGYNSPFTVTAHEIVEACRFSLEMYSDRLKKYELSLKSTADDSLPETEQNLTFDHSKGNSSKLADDSFINKATFDDPDNSIQDSLDKSDCDMDVASDAYKVYDSKSANTYSNVDFDNKNHELGSFLRVQRSFPNDLLATEQSLASHQSKDNKIHSQMSFAQSSHNDMKCKELADNSYINFELLDVDHDNSIHNHCLDSNGFAVDVASDAHKGSAYSYSADLDNTNCGPAAPASFFRSQSSFPDYSSGLSARLNLTSDQTKENNLISIEYSSHNDDIGCISGDNLFINVGPSNNNFEKDSCLRRRVCDMDMSDAYQTQEPNSAYSYYPVEFDKENCEPVVPAIFCRLQSSFSDISGISATGQCVTSVGDNENKVYNDANTVNFSQEDIKCTESDDSFIDGQSLDLDSDDSMLDNNDCEIDVSEAYNMQC